MSFRTIVITNQAHLNYKNDYLVIKKDAEIKRIHISEISTLLIDSTMVSFTSYLLLELTRNKVKVIFCDEKRNPYGELLPYFGNYNSSKKIGIQIKWKVKLKKIVWQQIIIEKIYNQGKLLKKIGNEGFKILDDYVKNVTIDDGTNREGHAAKVYFNCLFGKSFSRRKADNINAALNYGYAIILSTISKEISSNGYLTQIGIKHKNEFNNYNLACDLMEPFRPIIDDFVYFNCKRTFDQQYKMDLVNLLNSKQIYMKKQYYLSDIIKIYVRNVLDILENGRIEEWEGFFMNEK